MSGKMSEGSHRWGTESDKKNALRYAGQIIETAHLPGAPRMIPALHESGTKMRGMLDASREAAMSSVEEYGEDPTVRMYRMAGHIFDSIRGYEQSRFSECSTSELGSKMIESVLPDGDEAKSGKYLFHTISLKEVSEWSLSFGTDFNENKKDETHTRKVNGNRKGFLNSVKVNVQDRLAQYLNELRCSQVHYDGLLYDLRFFCVFDGEEGVKVFLDLKTEGKKPDIIPPKPSGKSKTIKDGRSIEV